MNETFCKSEDIEKLDTWFLENQRDFPWRQERTPYRVWVSEVMLQQTRASVVVPYFLKWMELFPDVKILASSSIEKVIKAWEGLGYYRRARFLHEGAREICRRFGGEIPSSKEALDSIPGLGPYTIGAILSFGFHQRSKAIDGNVARVLSRYFLIEENICKAAPRKRLETKGDEFLSLDAPWVTAEALIELGATICTPKPRCSECPLADGCLGLKSGKAEALPIKSAPPETVLLSRMVAIIECEGSILVQKEKKGILMGDLYQFPYFEMGREIWSGLKLVQAIKKGFGLKVDLIRPLSSVQHTFTRYKAQLHPFYLSAAQKVSIVGWDWISIKNLDEYPFCSGHRQILKGIK